MPVSDRVFHSICVFCGSSSGTNDSYGEVAHDLGRLIASRGLRLVYGGSNVGLMRTVADAALAAGGTVVGVIPNHLVDREVAHQGLTELRVVQSMHERKAMMSDLASAFVALPGGIGTLEEFFEVWTWGQLGLHRKPYALLNVAGFFDPLITFLDRLADERFVRPQYRESLLVESDPARLLDRLPQVELPAVAKRVERATT